MRNILYLLRNAGDPPDCILPSQHEGIAVSVVLAQDAVASRHLSADRVFVLSEDAVSRGVTPAFPAISYQDLLRMMFEADSVIAV